METTIWGEENQAFLRRFFPYANGIPSHDTLCDAFAAIDPELFKSCFLTWVEDLRDGAPEIMAIDGKTSRRSHNRGKGRKPPHMVSAWATSQRIVLGQETAEEKSNEITAIPRLLRSLDLRGAVVTLDARGHTDPDRPSDPRWRRALRSVVAGKLGRRVRRDHTAVRSATAGPDI